jgi:hypothetical protein
MHALNAPWKDFNFPLTKTAAKGKTMVFDLMTQ